MHKVLGSLTLDTQHIISWMHLTHEVSSALQKDGLGSSIFSFNKSCFLERFSASNTKRMFPFLCFVTRQHQPRMLDNAGSVRNQVCFGTCEQGSYIMTPTWTLKRCFSMIIADVIMVVGVHCYVAKEYVCSFFYNF